MEKPEIDRRAMKEPIIDLLDDWLHDLDYMDADEIQEAVDDPVERFKSWLVRR